MEMGEWMMKIWTEDDRTRTALWRFELISPLVTRELPRGARSALVRELASQFHVSENGQLITVGQRSIERYLACYRKGGLEALKPQVRPEKNSLKAFPQEALNEAIQLRLTKPELSADIIIDVLKTRQIPGAENISVSTLNRHFRRLGKDRPAYLGDC